MLNNLSAIGLYLGYAALIILTFNGALLLHFIVREVLSEMIKRAVADGIALDKAEAKLRSLANLKRKKAPVTFEHTPMFDKYAKPHLETALLFASLPGIETPADAYKRAVRLHEAKHPHKFVTPVTSEEVKGFEAQFNRIRELLKDQHKR